jgi:hypothetical protein
MRTVGQALVILVAVAVSLGALHLSYNGLQQMGLDREPFLLTGFLVMFLIALAIHEAGHLLSAWATGLRVVLVRVLFVKLAREAGRFRLWFDGSNLLNLSGLVVAYSADIRRLRHRLAVFQSGGVLANLLLGLAFLAALAGVTRWPCRQAEPTWKEWFLSLRLATMPPPGW